MYNRQEWMRRQRMLQAWFRAYLQGNRDKFAEVEYYLTKQDRNEQV